MEEIAGLIRDGAVALADAIQRVSPQVWAMTRQQVLASAYVNIITCGSALVVAVILFIVGLYIAIKHKDALDDFAPAPPIIAGIILGVVLFVSVIVIPEAAQRILAPDYYTLLKVVDLIK